MYKIYFVICLVCLSLACNQSTGNETKVYLRLGADIQKINPLLSGDAYARQVEELIYQPLFQFDNEGKELLPVLADGKAKISKVDDGLIYIFKIKGDADWADGQPVTGHDVQFTFRQLFNPYLPTHGFRSYLHFLDSIVVDVLDPKVFKVYTNNIYFLAETVLSNIEIFPGHFHDPDQVLHAYSVDELRQYSMENAPAGLKELAIKFESQAGSGQTLGSGPYQLAAWTKGEQVLLEKKENYWGEKYGPKWLIEGKSDWIDFRIIPDVHSAWASMMAGELDVMHEVPDEIFKNNCDGESLAFQCFSPNQYLYYYIGLNRRHPALATPSLRRGLAQCLDVDHWLREHLAGLAVRIHNPISPLKPYYLAEVTAPTFQPSEAVKQFREAGWSDINGDGIREKKVAGEMRTLRLRYSYVAANDQGKKIGLFFKSQAARVGVDIVLDPLDFVSLRERLRSRDFDLYYLATYDPPADYDPRPRWHTEAATRGNYFGFGSPESDRIIEDIGLTLDPTERSKLYREFQRLIIEDQPCIFLFSPRQKVIARKNIALRESGLWPGYRAQSVIPD